MSQQINLFNPIFLKQKKYFSATTMLQALGLVLLGLLAIYGFARYQTAAQTAALATAGERLATQRAQLAKVAAEVTPAGRPNLLQEEISRLEARLASRQALLSAIAGEIDGNREGYAATMIAFARQAAGGAWLTGFSIATDNSLTVKGRVLSAELVPAYLRALSSEDVMRGRGVASLTLTAMESSAVAGGVAATPQAVRSKEPPRFIEFSVRVAPRAGQPAQ